MKPADPELAALLATHRTFVMWEEYQFTFANNDTVTFSTKDQDSTRRYEEPPPPPPAGPTWLEDTFTGTASDTLATHVGEVGANWSDGTVATSSFALTGDGNVQHLGGPGNVIASGVAPAGNTNFYMEFEFSVSDGDQAELQSQLFGTFGVRIQAFGDSGVVKLGAVVITFSDFFVSTYNTGLASGAGTSYVCWAEVSGARKSVALGVGSARGIGLVATVSLNQALPDPSQTIFYMSGDTALVSRVKGGGL